MSSINGPAGYTIKQRNRGLFGGECCQLCVTMSHASHCHVNPVTSMSRTTNLLVTLRYKILFLDVLFPLNVKKIIFVDADQVMTSYDITNCHITSCDITCVACRLCVLI